jgi:penicillin-binding protein 1A
MRKFIRLSLLFVLVISSSLLVATGIVVWNTLSDLPNLDALKNYQPPQSTIVLDRNQQVVGRFYDEKRTVISIKNLPDHIKLAFVAAEDGDFFKHSGIDYFGLMRAIALEIKYRTIGGRRVGGSTITQQTARTMLLSSNQTYVRKLKEIVLAHRIEKALSKDEILHLYLNQIYFGNGAYGIEEAAQTYFLKPAKSLALFEAAALASIPKSPNRINPFNDADRLKTRQHYVLDQMVRHKFISKNKARIAKEAPLFSGLIDKEMKPLAPYFLQAVKSELLQKMSDEVIQKGGLKVFSTLDKKMQTHAEKALTHGLLNIDRRSGYRGPLVRPNLELDKIISLSLDTFRKRAFLSGNKEQIWDLSRLSKTIVNRGSEAIVDNIRLTNIRPNKTVGARILQVDARKQLATIDLGSKIVNLSFTKSAWTHFYSSQGKKAKISKISDVLRAGDIILVNIVNHGNGLSFFLTQDPLINGGLVALDVKTGAVLALVGGYDFKHSSFNRITQAKRQLGSGIKPLIYALAIDRELATPVSIITDVPKAFFDPGTDEFWRPRNYTHRYLGDITFRRCLRSSVNTCTLTLLEKIGLDSFLSFLKVVELNTKETPFKRNLTIALGSAENYPLSVANAMRILGNEGKYSPYFMIDSIQQNNSGLEKIQQKPEQSVIRPESAFIITNILQEVLSENKSSLLNNIKSQLAGKTGTTNNARSTWFFGYSPEILTLVYVGYDDNRSIGENEWGITTAFPIWAKFMDAILGHKEELKFLVPRNIEWRPVNKETGKVKAFIEEEEDSSDTILEAFITNTAPEFSLEENTTRKNFEAIDEAAFAP